MIEENLKTVEENIIKACNKANRKREEVTLIAVSKTKPVALIEEAINEGIMDFGENKVQELVWKYDELPENLRWHMIGHLQRNKVKYIIEKVSLIHSVDSLRLAETIHSEGKKQGIVVPILIEVNIAKEESKYGVLPENTLSLIMEIAKLQNVAIKGLMTIAPNVSNAEDNRVHFNNLNKLYVDIKYKNIDNVSMNILSMGMTGDYQIAIEEGATMVRVGTGIFGERNYNR